MRRFRLALAQMNAVVGDLDDNARKIREFIDEARAQGADLVAFPELAVSGYPPEDLLFKPQFIRDNMKQVERLAAHAREITVVVGFAMADGDLYNAAAILHEGAVAGVYHKMYLPNYGVFDEDRYFKAGTVCPVYVVNGVAVGVNICEDIWYAVGPTAVQRDAGAQVIVNINASPYHRGKVHFRERMVATRASDNGLFVAYVNMVGGQDELVFDGASMIMNERGELLARAKQFEEELVVADLDVDAVFSARLHDPRPRKEHPSIIREIGQAQVVRLSEQRDTQPRPPLPPPSIAPLKGSVEEVYAALVTGTRDYVHKNGFTKVLIGLSGGIDSSITAAIAVNALGAENVVGVSMPSRYTSEASITDAAVLAESLGVQLHTIPIEETVSAYAESLAELFRGMAPDVAEENIQARIRGNLLMAISNKFGWLVLTTGNKSEMATGYCTLYGDMAGGFAVLKDVPKTLVYELAEYRNAWPPAPVISRSVLEKAPTAELRPNQRDEDSLPPYRLLDPILQAYVEEDRSFADIVDMGLDPEVVKRAISLVDHSEYKRRQAPPGVKITPRAFGRDRRLPIVNRYHQF
ncbi:MAG: NAD+ synthase [Chloroflexi bacterium]|nr:NAD+ synthase [Chloroflexota bacterium]